MISDMLIKHNDGSFKYLLEECYPNEYTYAILYNESVYLRNYCITSKNNAEYEASELIKCLNKRFNKD